MQNKHKIARARQVHLPASADSIIRRNSHFLINKHEIHLFFKVCWSFQVIKFKTARLSIAGHQLKHIVRMDKTYDEGENFKILNCHAQTEITV